MPALDLCSMVFIVRPHTVFAPRQFLGRMAHKLFLSMLDHVDQKHLADDLHAQSTRLPYSVSNLFPNGSQHFWMRISGLTPELSQIVQMKLPELVGKTVMIEAREGVREAAWECTVEAAIPTHHEWARTTTYREFVNSEWQVPHQRRIRLEFVAPTAIMSTGLYRPFPLPHWIFRPLYDRWQRFIGVTLPFYPPPTYLEAYTEHFVKVQRYDIDCRSELPMKDPDLVAFAGWIEYKLLAANKEFAKGAQQAGKLYRDEPVSAIQADIERHRDQYAALIHLLAQFAFYSGVGKYTGQGMGMVQINERVG